MAREHKDYSDDDSTHTLSIITDITHCNCIVEKREYKYVEDDTLNSKIGVEITMETIEDNDDNVYRSLEELREQVEQDVEFDI